MARSPSVRRVAVRSETGGSSPLPPHSSHIPRTELQVWVPVGVRAPVAALGAAGRWRGRGVQMPRLMGPGSPEPGLSDRGRRLARNRPQRGRRTWITVSCAARNARAAVPASIDLGNEPPLSVDGETGIDVDRRRVSVQWFSGTILTGLCGAALMGGAVFASLDGETNFATSAGALRGGAAQRGRRQDELVAQERPAAAGRRSQRGAPAHPRSRPSTRSATARSCACARCVRVVDQPVAVDHRTVRQHSAVQSAEACSPTASTNAAERPSRPAPSRTPKSRSSPAISPACCRACKSRRRGADRRRDRARARRRQLDRQRRADDALHGRELPQPDAPSSPTPPRALDDPYAGFEARIVPENITLLPKTTSPDHRRQRRERAHRHGQEGRQHRHASCAISARRRTTSRRSSPRSAPRGRDGAVKEGQKLRVLLSPMPAAASACSRSRVVLLGDAGVEAVVALSDLGKLRRGRRAERRHRRSPTRGDDDEDDGERRAALSEHLRDRAAQPDPARR